MDWHLKSTGSWKAVIAAMAMVVALLSGAASLDEKPTDATTGASGKVSGYEAPADAKALYQRARIYLKQGNYPAALMRLQSALEADPAFAEAHYMSGRTLIKLGRLEQAREALGQAISLRPADRRLLGGALYTRGALRLEMGNPGKALKDLTAALELLPGYALIYVKRARAYQDMGEYEEALRDMEQAIEIAPDRAQALMEEIRRLRELSGGRY